MSRTKELWVDAMERVGIAKAESLMDSGMSEEAAYEAADEWARSDEGQAAIQDNFANTMAYRIDAARARDGELA